MQQLLPRAAALAVMVSIGLAGSVVIERAALAQVEEPAGSSGLVGTPEHEQGQEVLDQVLPESVGTPAEDERMAPAAGDLGDGFDADPTGALGRASEGPLGRAGSQGGGGAIVGESYGGGGVRVDGESSGGGGVDIDRRQNRDLTPGLSGDGSSPGLND